MQERDAYRIALLNASPNDPDSFAKGWLSALTWQTEVLVDALASAGLHGSNLQTAVLDNAPQPAITRKCPYAHCGWSTDDDTQPETLLQLHLHHSHPAPLPVVMPEKSGCKACGQRTNPREYDGFCPQCFKQQQTAEAHQECNPRDCVVAQERDDAAHTSVGSADEQVPYFEKDITL